MNEKTTEQTNIEAEESPLNWKTVFYISLFLGFLGIDRFYTGKKISGVLKLLTFGGFGIWWLVDLFIIACGQSTDASNRKIRNTTKQRVSAFIFLAPIIMILIMSLMVSLFSSPEERELRRVERAQKEAQKEAEREQKEQTDNLLNEKNYASAKKLFDEGKYDEALPILKNINSKHKEYNEVQNMIAFTNERLEMLAVTLILIPYISSKDDFNVSGASGKEFQSTLKNADRQISILYAVILNFNKIAKAIKMAENIQKYEFKYLKPQEKKNSKAVLEKTINQAKNKLKKEQLRDFPILRKEYAKGMAEAFWRNNIEVKASGNRNSRLEFTGGMFANNANIDDFQNKVLNDDIKAAIKSFRFKQVAYKWNKHDNEYTYYKYDTPSDEVEVSDEDILQD